MVGDNNTADQEVNEGWTDESVSRECEASNEAGRRNGLLRAAKIIADDAAAAFLAKRPHAELLRELSEKIRTEAKS